MHRKRQVVQDSDLPKGMKDVSERQNRIFARTLHNHEQYARQMAKTRRFLKTVNHFEDIHSYLPFDLANPLNFAIACLVSFVVIVLRYFAIAGLFYGIFWWRPSSLRRQRALYSVSNRSPQIRQEIFWSITASAIFAVGGALTGLAWQNGWTQIYLRFDEYPYWYLPVSLLLFSLVHDVYFYFSHRWMHIPWIYKRVHYVHHLSREPSPWASFCFHPLESLVEALILPLLVVIIPIHPVMFIVYLTLMTVSAVNNHLGYELLPAWAMRLGVDRLLISGRNHALHHKLYRCNYALYFTFLDRQLGTLSNASSET